MNAPQNNPPLDPSPLTPDFVQQRLEEVLAMCLALAAPGSGFALSRPTALALATDCARALRQLSGVQAQTPPVPAAPAVPTEPAVPADGPCVIQASGEDVMNAMLQQRAAGRAEAMEALGSFVVRRRRDARAQAQLQALEQERDMYLKAVDQLLALVADLRKRAGEPANGPEQQQPSKPDSEGNPPA